MSEDRDAARLSNEASRDFNRLVISLSGGIGAVAQDILFFYSKRWTAPELHFSLSMYLYATALYISLAVFIVNIFPFRSVTRNISLYNWIAMAIGAGLPWIIGALATFAKGINVTPRGAAVGGGFWDLIAI